MVTITPQFKSILVIIKRTTQTKLKVKTEAPEIGSAYYTEKCKLSEVTESQLTLLRKWFLSQSLCFWYWEMMRTII